MPWKLCTVYTCYIELLKRTNLQKLQLHHLLRGWNPTQHPPCLCLCPNTPGWAVSTLRRTGTWLGLHSWWIVPWQPWKDPILEKMEICLLSFPKHATQNASWAFGEVQHLCRLTIVMNHDACFFFGSIDLICVGETSWLVATDPRVIRQHSWNSEVDLFLRNQWNLTIVAP